MAALADLMGGSRGSPNVRDQMAAILAQQVYGGSNPNLEPRQWAALQQHPYTMQQMDGGGGLGEGPNTSATGPSPAGPDVVPGSIEEAVQQGQSYTGLPGPSITDLVGNLNDFQGQPGVIDFTGVTAPTTPVDRSDLAPPFSGPPVDYTNYDAPGLGFSTTAPDFSGKSGNPAAATGAPLGTGGFSTPGAVNIGVEPPSPDVRGSLENPEALNAFASANPNAAVPTTDIYGASAIPGYAPTDPFGEFGAPSYGYGNPGFGGITGYGYGQGPQGPQAGYEAYAGTNAPGYGMGGFEGAFGSPADQTDQVAWGEAYAAGIQAGLTDEEAAAAADGVTGGGGYGGYGGAEGAGAYGSSGPEGSFGGSWGGEGPDGGYGDGEGDGYGGDEE